jgi:hypothetical protein
MACRDCASVILFVATVCVADECATHGPAFFVRGMFSCEASMSRASRRHSGVALGYFRFPAFFPAFEGNHSACRRNKRSALRRLAEVELAQSPGFKTAQSSDCALQL